MSLRSIIREGRFYFNWQDRSEPDGIAHYRGIVHEVMTSLRSIRTISVNAQSVWEDISPTAQPDQLAAWDKALNFAAVPKPKPCFQCMWLEALIKADHGAPRERIGALVKRFEMAEFPGGVKGFLDALEPKLDSQTGAPDTRIRTQLEEDNPATVVTCMLLHDYEGSAVWTGALTFTLDAAGNFIWSFRKYPLIDWSKSKIKSEQHELETYKLRLKVLEAWILATFARLNCDNVELRPINEGKFRPHAPNVIVPASVWHEIVITSVPKIRSGGHDIFEQDEREVRAHWIRGHYADYRKGPGLFGNPKLRCLYWIPEHRRGNEELGQVIPEYTIQ